MDLNYTGDTTSGREGIDLLARVQELDRLLPVIVMTGWGSVDLAVEAMRRGVRDFVQKPWDNAHLLATLRHEIDAGRERRRDDARRAARAVRGAAIQQRLLPQQVPQIDGWEIAVVLAARVGRRRRLLRRHPLRRHASRALHRRRRRQGHPGGAADVEPAGGGARVRVRSGRARRRSATRSTASCAATSPKDASSAFSTACSTPPRACSTYTNAGPLPADAGARRRPRRAARQRRAGARRDRRRRLRAGAVALGAGDRLVLFTDGLTEARNAGGRRVRRGTAARRRRRAPRAAARRRSRRGSPEAVAAFTRRTAAGRRDLDRAGGRPGLNRPDTCDEPQFEGTRKRRLDGIFLASPDTARMRKVWTPPWPLGVRRGDGVSACSRSCRPIG